MNDSTLNQNEDSQRHTRIALLTAVIFIMVTMLGLGVYIIENPPASLFNLNNILPQGKNNTVGVDSGETNNSIAETSIILNEGNTPLKINRGANVINDLGSSGEDDGQPLNIPIQSAESMNDVVDKIVTGKNVLILGGASENDRDHAVLNDDLANVGQIKENEFQNDSLHNKGQQITRDSDVDRTTTTALFATADSTEQVENRIKFEQSADSETNPLKVESDSSQQTLDAAMATLGVSAANASTSSATKITPQPIEIETGRVGRPLVPGQRIGGNTTASDNIHLQQSSQFNSSESANSSTTSAATQFGGAEKQLGQEDDLSELRETISMLDRKIAPAGSNDSDQTRSNVFSEATEGIAVIVNRLNHQEISIADLRNFYSDKISIWPSGKKVTLYHLPLESNTRQTFSKQVLNMSALEAARLESNRVITNSAINPSVTKGENLVKAYVARNPHAIGYLPLSEVKDHPNIRVVMTLNN